MFFKEKKTSPLIPEKKFCQLIFLRLFLKMSLIAKIAMMELVDPIATSAIMFYVVHQSMGCVERSL